MDPTTIVQALKKEPFNPFTLCMNDGREFFVPHPEFIAVSSRVVFVIDPQTEAGILLEPMLIASLKPVESSAPHDGKNST